MLKENKALVQRLAEAIPLLEGVLADDTTDHSRRILAFSAVAKIGRKAYAQAEAIRILTQTFDTEEDKELREYAIMALGEVEHPDALKCILRVLFDEDEEEGIRRMAFAALKAIKDEQAIPYLGKILSGKCAFLDEDERRSVAWDLKNMGHNDAIPHLANGIVSGPSELVRENAANALRQMVGDADWQQRAKYVLESLKKSKKLRAEIDEVTILQAIMPPKEELAQNQHSLTDYLISQALGKDNRMTGILAKLIIQSAGESPLLAGERVNEYQEAHKIPQGELRKLRIEIGGETALDPIMETLKINLDEYFQKPIHKLNEHTRGMWQRTMIFAQIGLIARISKYHRFPGWDGTSRRIDLASIVRQFAIRTRATTGTRRLFRKWSWHDALDCLYRAAERDPTISK